MVIPIAFYLPQFHPIPENDAWWGKGFTEWTNTAKAIPLFDGHYQPKIPSDLGFYDLRNPESRIDQANLARQYGIKGFCYYHYWFGNGRRLLERPFDEVLASGAPDFPFCICWANQSWSGVWHGRPDEILIEQTYPGLDDQIWHFNYLLKAFRDDRYIKIDGKPLLIIFEPRSLPDPEKYLTIWRDLAQDAGFPNLYILGIRHLLDDWDPHRLSLDGAVDMRIPLPPQGWPNLGRGVIIDHREITRLEVPEPQPGIVHFPCIGPSWDNTPRLGPSGIVYINSDPDLFEHTVRRAVEYLSDKVPSQRLLFLKAWNEWAEGNYLEPDLKFGHGWLQALQRGLNG